MAGDVVTFGAAGAGAGKTSFALQLADGLALRSAELAEDAASREPLTPVLTLTEMPEASVHYKLLARICDVPASVFRAGAAAERMENDATRGSTDQAYDKARREIENGLFDKLAPWQRIGRPKTSGAEMLGEVVDEIQRWRAELRVAYPGRDVWPVVLVDPIQRWQSQGLSEVESLNALVETLDSLADEYGWIAIITSDTNKVAAVGKEEADRRGPNVFRGSYKLFHASEAVMLLDAAPPEPNTIIRQMTITIEKNRNGSAFGEATFRWNPATGLFTPEGEGRSPARTATASKSKASKNHLRSPTPVEATIPETTIDQLNRRISAHFQETDK